MLSREIKRTNITQTIINFQFLIKLERENCKSKKAAKLKRKIFHCKTSKVHLFIYKCFFRSMLSVLWRENSFVKLKKLARKNVFIPFGGCGEKCLRFFFHENFYFVKKVDCATVTGKLLRVFIRNPWEWMCTFAAVTEKVNLSLFSRESFEHVTIFSWSFLRCDKVDESFTNVFSILLFASHWSVWNYSFRKLFVVEFDSFFLKFEVQGKIFWG